MNVHARTNAIGGYLFGGMWFQNVANSEINIDQDVSDKTKLRSLVESVEQRSGGLQNVPVGTVDF